MFLQRGKRAIHYNLHVLRAKHTKFCDAENSEKKKPFWKYEMSNQDDHDNDGEMQERE